MTRATIAVCAILLSGSAIADPVELVGDLAFPEGPMTRDGDVIFTQYAGHIVSVWDGSELSTIWQGEGCGPSAIAPLGKDLAVTCYDDGTVARITAEGQEVARYDADAAGSALVGPNDFAPDGSGGLWMTTSGPWESGPIVGKIYHIAPDGTIEPRADDLHYANGIALSPDGARLFVNESEAGRVISFAVGADGTLSDRRLFARIAEIDPDAGAGAYPDGLKIGPDGNLWVGQYSSARITVIAPDGTFVAAHVLPGQAAPNLAFAPDGTVYAVTVDDTSGAPYPGRLWQLAD